MKLRSLIAAFVVLAFAASPAHAQLLNFYFTFTTTSGNITGEIEGLQNSGASTPTDIVIFTQPAGFTYPAESLLANGYQFYNSDNLFTVTSGAITSTGANGVVIYKLVGTSGYQAYGFDASEAGFNNVNGMVENNNGTVTGAYNSNGFTGATYTAVPETRRMGMVFLLAGVALLAGRKLHDRFLSKASV